MDDLWNAYVQAKITTAKIERIHLEQEYAIYQGMQGSAPAAVLRDLECKLELADAKLAELNCLARIVEQAKSEQLTISLTP